MIFDTDILIWCFRGNRRAADAIDSADHRAVSAVTLMELLQGARNKQEQRQIGKFLRSLDFAVIPVSENISHRACIYVEEYSLGSGIGVADALIAATAIEERLPLCTANAKHYRCISEIELVLFSPEGA